MGKALVAGKRIDTKEVLKLCRWVLAQDRPLEETEVRDEGIARYSDWGGARDEIASLIQGICGAKTGNVPTYSHDDFRAELWGLLDVLCRGRSRSYVVHDTDKDDPRVCDYLMLGVNSPRGKALEAAFEYARWVVHQIGETGGGGRVLPRGFDDLPELMRMLEWQIAPENRSVEALAVIGSRIGVICWIDSDWLASNAEGIFLLERRLDGRPDASGWAAWNAFLVWVRPHVVFYKLLKRQFEYAVLQAAVVEAVEHHQERPMNHLGEHLVILYGRGEVALDDDSPLKQFLKTAYGDVRRHAIGFVGSTLKGEAQCPTEVVGRFMMLWETYWGEEGKEDARQKPDAWLFGPWFVSGQFPEDWALEQLERFARVAGNAEPDHAVVERLVAVTQGDIARAVRILKELVRGDREGWRIHGWLDSAKRILEAAMRAGGEARILAEGIVNYLGRRGHTQFGELLSLPVEPGRGK
jgi:hypothetical protein